MDYKDIFNVISLIAMHNYNQFSFVLFAEQSSRLFGMKGVFKHKDLLFGAKLNR